MHFSGNGSCGSAATAAWFLSHKSDSAETVNDGNRPVWLMHFCKFARFGSGEEGGWAGDLSELNWRAAGWQLNLLNIGKLIRSPTVSFFDWVDLVLGVICLLI